MSQWTHVAGCIRIDDLRLNGNSEIDEIKRVMGKPLRWEDKDWDDKVVKRPPTGSEGSLEYDIWVEPNMSSLAAYTVSVWGDLRDYNDVAEIREWFSEIIDSFMIRDAVLSINVEYGPFVILSAREDTETSEMVVLETKIDDLRPSL